MKIRPPAVIKILEVDWILFRDQVSKIDLF